MIRLRSTPRMRRVAAASVALATLALVPAVASVGQTEAAWVNSEHATTTATAPTVRITKGTCTLSGGSLLTQPTTATFAWSYPPASQTVIVPSSVTYQITNSTNAVVFGPTTAAVAGTPLGPTSFQVGVGQGAVGTYTATVVPSRTWAGNATPWTGPAITYTLVVSQDLLGTRYFSSCT
ncbi:MULTISPECIES: hypothetical protein [unclassified Agrococcus]|uniref:hypothetical protein n=1 Tax=unclassified Agrococcus TaxID=2615065 RepID=UPI0036174A63